MDASHEMKALLSRIYMPSVFYYPKDSFSELSQETKKALEKYEVFEDVGIIKVNGDSGSLKTSMNALEIYKKDGVLEGNVFQLLEMKERLGRDSFVFLLDNYLSNVKVWIKAYNNLLKNFDKQFTETLLNEKSLFEYQLTTLDNHLIKLKQKFKFNFKNPATTNSIDVLSKNEKVFPFDKSINDNIKEGVKQLNQNKEDKTGKQLEKQILLTEKEADDYLLKTVFNINRD